MTIPQAVFSGILQGITEFFPISSAGHLVLLHQFFGFKESQILFDIVLHIATGLAVLIYFRQDIKALFTTEKDLGILVLIACIPTFIIGFLFADFFEKFFVNVKMVGVALIITGVWLFTANLVNRKIMHRVHAQKGQTNLYPWKALVIGAAQGVALIPGISRSGATIATGLLCGLGSNLAFRFSFLILLPATVGAVIYKLKNITPSAPGLTPILAGAITAFFVGFFTLKALSKILKQGKVHIFGFYCIGLGLLIWFMK